MSGNIRDMLRNDRNFRDRFMDELILQLAVRLKIVDEEGRFDDEALNVRVGAPTVTIAGRPLHHYMGLTAKHLDAMGLTEAEKDEVRVHLNLVDEPRPDTPIPLVNWPAGAPVPPADIPQATEEGTEHPRLAEWARGTGPTTDKETAKATAPKPGAPKPGAPKPETEKE